MKYTPEHQYRCTIIRGKSQQDIEDMLPKYAEIVHSNCPCTKVEFVDRARRNLSMLLFGTSSFDKLSFSNQKTVNNHLTEIAGSLLCLYYISRDEETGIDIVYETASCKFIHEHQDNPTFFKNLCLNFQFPNGAKWEKYIEEDISNKINIKPYCYVVALLYCAQTSTQKVLLTKQEIGYYVLNNLDVLQGEIEPSVVYERIITDRKNKVRRNKLSGSREWQHIKEQFNWLELSNIIESDSTYVWLNSSEQATIKLFIEQLHNIGFDAYSYPLKSSDDWKLYLRNWRRYYGGFREDLLNVRTSFATKREIAASSEMHQQGSVIKNSIELGDEGEALVYRIEQERVRQYKERLVNKVLLLGKQKGLGYDISSIEAGENKEKPEFARYIEVKSTQRVTEPSFSKEWVDSVNLTSKEWVAAEQYGEYYNIYRVYFTKKKTIVVRIKNPYYLNQNNKIEVFPTVFQMNFDSSVIEKRYEE